MKDNETDKATQRKQDVPINTKTHLRTFKCPDERPLLDSPTVESQHRLFKLVFSGSAAFQSVLTCAVSLFGSVCLTNTPPTPHTHRETGANLEQVLCQDSFPVGLSGSRVVMLCGKIGSHICT